IGAVTHYQTAHTPTYEAQAFRIRAFLRHRGAVLRHSLRGVLTVKYCPTIYWRLSRTHTMIIVKTTSVHSQGVRRNRKYATDDPPIELSPGDDVLVQVTVATTPPGQHTIRYRMKFVRYYLDERNESLA